MDRKIFAGQFVKELGHLIEHIDLPDSIDTELKLEREALPFIIDFVNGALPYKDGIRPIFYYHGITKEEKQRWSESKKLQNVSLFGANTFDMFLQHPKIGALAIEFKYVKSDRDSIRLTSQIQRAVGQSIIAKLRHPFAICFIVYRKQKKLPLEGLLKTLKRLLWQKHHIYLIIRPQ